MQISNTEKVKLIIEKVTQWASHRTDLIAVALVGSWARGLARIDSDIDLMFLTANSSSFRQDETWMNEISWAIISAEIDDWEDKDYGILWSRHIYLDDKTVIEFSFGFPSWASVDPIDAGTFRVINDGCQILYDPKNVLSQLVNKIRSLQNE